MNLKSSKLLLTRNLTSQIKGEKELSNVAKFIMYNLELLKEDVRLFGRVNAIRLWYAKVDHIIQKNREENKNGSYPISCKKGCAFCCHINVDVTTIEVEAILSFCKDHNISINYDLFRNQLNLSSEDRPISQHSRCAFLGEGNVCTIYPVRPMNCRTYFVASDPEKCDSKTYPNHENTVIQVNLAELINNVIVNYSGKYFTMQQAFLNKQTNGKN